MNRFFRPRKNIGLLLRARARKGGYWAWLRKLDFGLKKQFISPDEVGCALMVFLLR